MKNLIISAALTAAVGTGAKAEPAVKAENPDSFLVKLHDVEIVGVKQMPNDPLELTTTVTAGEIERFDIRSIKNIAEIAPNFYMPAYGSRMTSSIYVRGLGARMDQPVVGLNVDNVPYLNKDNYDFDMADIARIEVIRGSSSVLNGRNAMGGQINVVTLSPWDYEGARVKLQYGRGNSLRFTAGYYYQFSDKLATSITNDYSHTDGFFRNTHDNTHTGREDSEQVRWKLSWHPDSRWSLLNTASFGYSKQHGYPYESVASGKICYNDSTFYKRTMVADGLTVSYTGRRMIATSITSVQYSDDNMTLDQDFLPEDYFTLTQKRREWTVTEDLFAKGTRGKYDWTLGAFGFYKKGKMDAPVTFKDTGIRRLIEDNVNRVLPKGMELKWDSRRLLLGSNFDIKDAGFALYHQSTVRLGALTLLGGLRWDIEYVGLDYVSSCQSSCTMYRQLPTGHTIPLGTRPVDIDDHGHLSQTFNELLPQLEASLDLGDWNLRATATKGYKAGGYNTQMFSDVLQQQIMEQMGVEAKYDIEKMMTYKPEKSWTYEVSGSYKTERLQAEATVFLMNCRDQQLTVFPEGNTTGRAMTNAGRTRSYGVELTLQWQPADSLRLRASYGYTHATFTKYDNGINDLKGKRLPYAPENTLFVAATYSMPWEIGGFKPEITVNTRGVGNIYWDEMNTVSQKFYATLGARAAFRRGGLTLAIEGENLTNTRYALFYFESIGNRFTQQANPWTLSGSVSLNF